MLKGIEISKEYRTYKYIVLFNIDYGWRCGYIGIPEYDKFYKADINDFSDIDCHGGISFAEFWNELGLDLWWIGFSCNEYNDGWDFDAMRKYKTDAEIEEFKKYQKNDNLIFRKAQCHAWTAEEVEAECKKVIDQLIRLSTNYNSDELTSY